MPTTKFLTKKELSAKLNYTEKEIDDLVLKRLIPYHKRDGKVLFPMEEVLAQYSPRPKKDPPKQKQEKKKESNQEINPESGNTPLISGAAEDEGF